MIYSILKSVCEDAHTSRLIASPSKCMTVSGETMQYGPGSVSTTLNSTALMPPRIWKMSPFLTGGTPPGSTASGIHQRGFWWKDRRKEENFNFNLKLIHYLFPLFLSLSLSHFSLPLPPPPPPLSLSLSLSLFITIYIPSLLFPNPIFPSFSFSVFLNIFLLGVTAAHCQTTEWQTGYQVKDKHPIGEKNIRAERTKRKELSNIGRLTEGLAINKQEKREREK